MPAGGKLGVMSDSMAGMRLQNLLAHGQRQDLQPLDISYAPRAIHHAVGIPAKGILAATAKYLIEAQSTRAMRTSELSPSLSESPPAELRRPEDHVGKAASALGSGACSRSDSEWLCSGQTLQGLGLRVRRGHEFRLLFRTFCSLLSDNLGGTLPFGQSRPLADGSSAFHLRLFILISYNDQSCHLSH